VTADAPSELGRELALLAGALDSEATVLGGGLGSAPGPCRDAIMAERQAGLWDSGARALPFLRAEPGPDAGIVGAAPASARAEMRGVA
jgi:hypothetical protein